MTLPRFIAWLNRSLDRDGLVFVDTKADSAVRRWMWARGGEA